MREGYIFVANNIFPTLLAVSIEEQSRGLMFEPWPPPIMSFVYSSPQVNRFWMHNTPSPLDLVFCRQGQIVQICQGEPFSTSMLGDRLSDLVIEFPAGTVLSSGIKLGHKVGLVSPTAEELKKIIGS